MELGEAQKSSPEAFESLEDDLKSKRFDFHETIETSTKSLILQAPKASWEFRCASKMFES